MAFDPNGAFIWGAATASYQIEGAMDADGKGLSIWDVYSHTPGKVYKNDNGDTACDSYHRLEEDLALIGELGVRHYRFSISWPRIIPDGDGAVNEKGFDYYDRLVDGLLERGITPWMTLFHWDLPQSLEERFGGWRSRKTAEAFGRFAKIVAEHFKGRVKNWFVLNEPQCFSVLGYERGIHAPGLRLGPDEVFGTWHNAMLAYGFGARALRETDPENVVSVASTGRVCMPLDGEDAETAAKAMFTMRDDDPGLFCQQMFLDPIVFGRYPDCTGTAYEQAAVRIPEEDLEIINVRPDVIGLNIYHGVHVKRDGEGWKEKAYDNGWPRTAIGWQITEEALYWGPKLVYERYGLPVLISENGMSGIDRVFLDGKVHDPFRTDYLTRYIGNFLALRKEGVPACGYFHWSLLDNFEWADGYDQRFGLVYVDYETKKRTPKDSYYWYRGFIRTNP